MPRLKVLLVDDEKEFASTLGERLEMRGFQARVVSNGREALSEIDKNPPQVVVLDIKMPGLGGVEVLKLMKSAQQHIPVILLTGIGSTAECDECMKLGAFDFLVKPVQIETLVAKLEEAVKSGS